MSLKLDGVSKRVRGATHISDVSAEFEAGSLTVLLGQTLSGKTTLMRLMAGLDKPTTGRVLVDGADVTGMAVSKRSVAMVYQQFINYPALTVFENIASPLRVQKRPKDEIERRVAEAARLLKLEPLLQRLPLELSGGQQQRCAIARALVKDAKLVLLDEPLANLDYKLREELRDELPKIFAASGAILVYATTEPTEALLLGGRTATLHEGRITQVGPTLDVFRKPHDRRTAEVFSDPPMNFADVRVSGAKIELADGVVLPALGGLAHLADGAAAIGFRANHLALERQNADAMAVRAAVSVVEITGSESFVHVRPEGMGGDAPVWIALARGVHDLAPGTVIDVWLDPHRMFAFAPDGKLAAAPALEKAA